MELDGLQFRAGIESLGDFEEVSSEDDIARKAR
jgi:hypothetical protein